MVTGKDTKSAPKEFQAKPFAFFKLANDGLRTGVQEVLRGVEGLGDDFSVSMAEVAKSKLRELAAAVDALDEIEFAGLFPLLDMTFDEVVKKGKFSEDSLECRDSLRKVEEEMEKVISNGEMKKSLKKAMRAWVELFEASLKRKEETFTPLYAKISPDLYGRAKAVNDILKSTSGLAVVRESLIGYVLKQLVHVKRSYGHARMFCSIVQTVLSAEEFNLVKPTMETAAGVDTWAQLLKDGMKKGGKLVDPNAPSTGMQNAKGFARKSLKKSKSLLLKARKSFTLHAAMVNTKAEQDEFDVLETKTKS